MDAMKTQLKIESVKVVSEEDSESGEKGCFVQARATVSYPIDKGYRRLETFTSGGLGGVEGDESYFREIEAEQLEDLRQHLKVFGVPVPRVLTATKS